MKGGGFGPLVQQCELERYSSVHVRVIEFRQEPQRTMPFLEWMKSLSQLDKHSCFLSLRSAAGIPAFCFLTQYPSLPASLDPSKLASSFTSSLPAKTISTLHSIPANPMSRAAGRAAGAAAQAGGRAAGQVAAASSTAAKHEGFLALSAATMALSLVPTAIGIIEVAFHERKLGDVQSWTEDLRHLAYRVGNGELVDGMDMYCLSDERWDELPWKTADEDVRDLAY